MCPPSNPLLYTQIRWGSFLPKLQEYIAEFLNESYLEHLSILYQPTCVGLRYGHTHLNLEVISWKPGFISYYQPKLISPRLSAQNTDFPVSLNAYHPERGLPTPRFNYPSPSLHRTLHMVQEYKPASHRLRLSASS